MERSSYELTLFKRYLRTLPWRTGHLDQSSWRAALRAGSLGIDPRFIFQVLCALITRAGDIPNHSKIASQISRAYSFVREGYRSLSVSSGRMSAHRNAPIEFRPEALASLAAKLNVENVENVEEFVRARSPINPDSLDSLGFLLCLYPDEKVLVFTDMHSQGQALWTSRMMASELPVWGPDGVWFLPNPVDGLKHPNARQGGKLSRRSQESITSFRYAVLESDEADAEQWLRFLAQAPLRLSAIYTSGGRSIHALVRVDAENKEDWDALITPVKPQLTVMGADPAALTAVRLSRLPQAWRGEKRQRLIFLNPNPTEIPIRDLPARAISCSEGLRSGPNLNPVENNEHASV